jgi:hypothetical protein
MASMTTDPATEAIAYDLAAASARASAPVLDEELARRLVVQARAEGVSWTCLRHNDSCAGRIPTRAAVQVFLKINADAPETQTTAGVCHVRPVRQWERSHRGTPVRTRRSRFGSREGEAHGSGHC